ncbi:hypothetical protein L9F63_019363, partial [Diploptera punctata]
KAYLYSKYKVTVIIFSTCLEITFTIVLYIFTLLSLESLEHVIFSLSANTPVGYL